MVPLPAIPATVVPPVAVVAKVPVAAIFGEVASEKNDCQLLLATNHE
jgi:hypothetical protein